MNGEEIYQVGIYIRLSKEDGDDGESESVENQRDLIQNFIEKHEDLEFGKFSPFKPRTGGTFGTGGTEKEGRVSSELLPIIYIIEKFSELPII